MSATLTGAERAKLVKVLALLSSNHDGERAAAGFMASRMLRDRGIDWDSLIAPAGIAPSWPLDGGRAPRSPMSPASAWSRQIGLLLRHPEALTEWERSFARSLATRMRISPKQVEIVFRVYDRLIAAGVR